MEQQINNQLGQHLPLHGSANVLRVVVLGGSNDGESNPVDRLLNETAVTADEQLEAVIAESNSSGAAGDIRYRAFSTANRKFIAADGTGLKLYTPNIVSAASNADVVIILCDAREGLQELTRRHTYLSSVLGVSNIVLGVNTFDATDNNESIFNDIVDEYNDYAAQLELNNITAIPLSAANTSELLAYLETVELDSDAQLSTPFRLPVQSMDSLDGSTKGFNGTVVSGTVKPGDTVRIAPSGKASAVARIITSDGDIEQAVAGQTVTLTLTDDFDLDAGEVISSTEMPINAADQFESNIVGLSQVALLPGRPYFLKIGTKTVTATITDIKHQINVNTMGHWAAKQLEADAITVCNINTDQQVAFDAYTDNRHTGGFELIDTETNVTVAAGTLNFALRRSDNIHMQAVDVDKQARATMKNQKACVVWFTGLSGSGKSTVANVVERKLAAQGQHTYLLDGDNVRHGLNKDLGFTDADRVENIRRIGEVAKLMVDSGLIVMTAFISPFRSERGLARSLVEAGEFIEVHVDTPLEIAEQRDPKGLYKKARRGELKNFTGIDSPYEAPENPEIIVDTGKNSAEEAADLIIAELRKSGFVS